MKASIKSRVPIKNLAAMLQSAEEAGVRPVPVFNRGRVDEVHLFHRQGVIGSLFQTPSGEIGAWITNLKQRAFKDIPKAIKWVYSVASEEEASRKALISRLKSGRKITLQAA